MSVAPPLISYCDTYHDDTYYYVFKDDVKNAKI